MRKIAMPNDEIVCLYLSGESIRSLSKRYDVSHDVIDRVLDETNTPKRDRITLTQVDDDGRVCTKCLVWMPWVNFETNKNHFTGFSSSCKGCRIFNMSSIRRSSLKRKGWTPEMKEVVIDLQGGSCANPNCTRSATDADHDHDTKEARGVLCNKCNTALGALLDDPFMVEGLLAYAKQCRNAKEWWND